MEVALTAVCLSAWVFLERTKMTSTGCNAATAARMACIHHTDHHHLLCEHMHRNANRLYCTQMRCNAPMHPPPRTDQARQGHCEANFPVSPHLWPLLQSRHACCCLCRLRLAPGCQAGVVPAQHMRPKHTQSQTNPLNLVCS